jgi:outer membrane lipoprotein carrier protein
MFLASGIRECTDMQNHSIISTISRVFWIVAWLCAAQAAAAAQDPLPELETIMKGIEQRYAGKGFAAKFFQESMLKAMQISDTAEGTLTVEKPDKMRWAYLMPDEQTIITDGNNLWIYRPADNQVVVGKATEFFGLGKGAGFLSDIRKIRKNFHITVEPAENQAYDRLSLVPLKPNPELSRIVLSVDRETHKINQVLTYNQFGDETRIVLSDYRFNIDPDDDLFTFEIPAGVDVIHMNQP